MPACPRLCSPTLAWATPGPTCTRMHAHTHYNCAWPWDLRSALPGQQQTSLRWLLGQVLAPSDGPALGEGDRDVSGRSGQMSSAPHPEIWHLGPKLLLGPWYTPTIFPPPSLCLGSALHREYSPSPRPQTAGYPSTHRGTRGKWGALLLASAHDTGPQFGGDVGDMG